MEKDRTPHRKNKILSVASKRQKSLKVILENIHDPHNVSAIFRTCDAVGVREVSLIYNEEKFPKIGKKSSASAYKWVEKLKYKTVRECYDNFHKSGYKIYATSLNANKNFYELDLTKNSAIVFGNEHRGLSNEAEELADEKFIIPMQGMVQSLNVSVAAAVVLFEAMRQRIKKGMYKDTEYSTKELEELIKYWTNNK
ncbi:MAG: RNA methyltransferase [Ignavibacteriales bacterium CG_4_9_14_3_um_filter_30_11]|nr:MAG: RNA methyltransferase [Ignavibacteriales bacterium CG_4_9_14_3_um_filter_30_11]